MTDRIQVTRIDPAFTIPKGAEDEFVYTDTPIDVNDFDANIYPVDVTEPPAPSGLEAPSTFKVVHQVIKRGAKGDAQSVSIAFVTDDIANAVRYEIKVTKA